METVRKTTKRAQHLKVSPLLSLLAIILPLSLLFLSPTLIAQENQKVTIAITEIVEHPSLAQAKQGILDELKANGYEINKNLIIVDENAQGNISNASMIAKKFVSMHPNAIVPISTPSAQAVMNAAKTTEIPVVFSSVTDPVAAGLIKDLNQPQANMTGAIDFPPISEEIVLIKTFVPHLKKLGVLYNPGEANSVKTVKLLKEAVGDIQIIEATAPNSNHVGQALLSLVGKIDALYIPSDNTVFSAMPQLVKLSKQHHIPVFSSDPDSVKQGVLACAGYTQYLVGRTAGKLLIKVLKGEKSLKVTTPTEWEIYVNETTATALSIAVPDKINNIKTHIVK